VHLEANPDAVFLRETSLFDPVGLGDVPPLPVEGLLHLARPWRRDPDRVGAATRTPRAAGEGDDRVDTELVGESDRLAPDFMVHHSDGLVGMERIAVTRQRRDGDVTLIEHGLPPRSRLVVVDQLLERAMSVARVVAGADLDCVDPELLHVLQYLRECLVSHQYRQNTKLHRVPSSDSPMPIPS